MATVPGVRTFEARHSKFGPTATGSARAVSVRFGSVPETTARADTSSPDSRTTPVARPSFDVIDATAAPVRISTPTANRRGLECCRQRARSATGKDRLPGRSPIVAGQFREQHRRRPGRPRSHRGVLDAAPGDRRTNRVRLERFGHEVCDGHGEDAGDRPPVVTAQASERSAKLEPGERIRQAGRFDIGRRPPGELAEEPGQRPNEPVEAGVGVGVVRGTDTEALGRSADIAPQRHCRSVGRGCEGANPGRNERKTVPLEVEVAHDRRPQPPNRVRKRRHADPGCKLGGDSRASDARRPFENDGLQPRATEIRRRDQTVVPATDDDGVVTLGRHLRRPCDREPGGPRARRSCRSRP